MAILQLAAGSLGLWLDSPMCGAPWHQNRLFRVPPRRQVVCG